jgi:hypothetical protein
MPETLLLPDLDILDAAALQGKRVVFPSGVVVLVSPTMIGWMILECWFGRYGSVVLLLRSG